MSKSDDKRYFHMMSDSEWQAWQARENTTWRSLIDAGYLQPDWCTYPQALDGMMGCWSLVGRKVTGESYCLNCECYNEAKK